MNRLGGGCGAADAPVAYLSGASARQRPHHAGSCGGSHWASGRLGRYLIVHLHATSGVVLSCISSGIASRICVSLKRISIYIFVRRLAVTLSAQLWRVVQSLSAVVWHLHCLAPLLGPGPKVGEARAECHCMGVAAFVVASRAMRYTRWPRYCLKAMARSCHSALVRMHNRFGGGNLPNRAVALVSQGWGWAQPRCTFSGGLLTARACIVYFCAGCHRWPRGALYCPCFFL